MSFVSVVYCRVRLRAPLDLCRCSGLLQLREQGLPSAALHALLTAVASLTAERRLQVLGREGEVLLVDDDPAILRTTAILLKTIKVTVHAASNRSEALAAFRNYAQSLTCVILDANIDGVDSAQLIGSFRNI